MEFCNTFLQSLEIEITHSYFGVELRLLLFRLNLNGILRVLFKAVYFCSAFIPQQFKDLSFLFF